MDEVENSENVSLSSDNEEDEITSSEDEQSDSNEFENFYEYSPNEKLHMRCFAHTLQLVIKNSLKKINNIRKLLSKSYKVSAKYHQKKLFASVLEEKGYKAISKPIKVRWNSEINCLRSICKIKLVDLNEGLEKIEAPYLFFTYNDMSRLIDIANILEPFEYVSNEIQGSFKYITDYSKRII